MKISTQWLQEYIDLDHSPEAVEEALTLIGFEVEGVEKTGLPEMPGVVVGEVLESQPHPNADRLSVCRVSVYEGEEPRSIVCGAKNYKVGDRVPVALPGAELPGGFKIKASKLRGVRSEGMMCSGRELGISDDAEGLLILRERPEIGTSINELFPGGDVVYDVEVTPNRPDCLSHVGMARELAAYFGLELRYPEFTHSFSPENPGGQPQLIESVTVEAEEDCPLYMAFPVTGVKVGPSPEWLRRILVSVGLRPVNNVVDITNYVLLELGQPLHAFDAAKIGGRKLVIRRAREGEKLVTLDDKERELSKSMMVIADAGKPLVVAGVMGSIDAEVDESTTDIVLESACFRAGSIRNTSRRLNLSTDSSYRFERGVDPRGVKYAAQRALDLILDIAGGRIDSDGIQVGHEPELQQEITLDFEFIRRRGGLEIADQTIEEILESLELKVSRYDTSDMGHKWVVQIPGFRTDLEAPIDLVEEVVRIHGTDKIPEAPVRCIGLDADDDRQVVFSRRAADYLAGQHFNECFNYSLRSWEELHKWFSNAGMDSLRLSNPLSSDQSHLRWSLIPGLLDVLKLNRYRKTGGVRFFERGRTFRELEGAVAEVNTVCFVIFNPEGVRSWKTREPADFYTAKNLILNLAQLAGFDLSAEEVGPVPMTNSAWQEGHSAKLGDLFRGVEARLGLLNLALLKAYDLEGTVVSGILEILPEKFEQALPRPTFQPFSSYPAAERDLALLVHRDEMAGAVRRKLETFGRRAAGDSFDLENVALFDLYEGKGIPEGQKSLAFSLIFRAADRTLTEEEVNQVFQKVQDDIAKETSYRIRK